MTGDIPQRPPRNWHPGARQLYAYWLKKRRNDELPSRQDIDPVEITKLLPCIYLADVNWENGAPRVKFRLTGTLIVERFGRDVAGTWMDEVYDQDYFAEVWPAYLALIETKTPQYSDLTARYANKEHLTYSRLICPLSADGERIDMIIGYIGFADAKDAHAEAPGLEGGTA